MLLQVGSWITLNDHNPDSEMFLKTFVYYCNCYRQPTVSTVLGGDLKAHKAFYTAFRKKHPLLFSFISLWKMLSFPQNFL